MAAKAPGTAGSAQLLLFDVGQGYWKTRETRLQDSVAFGHSFQANATVNFWIAVAPYRIREILHLYCDQRGIRLRESLVIRSKPLLAGEERRSDVIQFEIWH